MKPKLKFPHYIVNEERFTDKDAAMESATSLATETDEPVKVILARGWPIARQIVATIHPQYEEVPA